MRLWFLNLFSSTLELNLTGWGLFLFDVGYEDHVPAGFGFGTRQRTKPWLLPVCKVVTSCALDSNSGSICGEPDYTTHLVTFWASHVVTDFDHFLFSPFFLLSTKYFLAVFFLNVQLVRTEDLHRLQFLTKPALNIHNLIYLYLFLVLKRFDFRQVQPRGQKETLQLPISLDAYKGVSKN